MTKSDAPERIWALHYECEDDPDAIAIGYPEKFFGAHEYVRADRIEELEAKLERAGGALDIAAATLNIVAWDEGFSYFDGAKREMVNDALDVTRVASAELKWPRGIADEY